MKRAVMAGVLCWIFVQGVYGQHFTAMVQEVTASSVLPPGQRDEYDAKNVLDRNDRSWAEGAAGSGIGEYLTFELYGGPRTITGFVLRNGYGNMDFYTANNRVKSFRVVFDGGYSEVVQVKDSWRFEQYSFSRTIRCSKVQFIINEVYKGSRYDDTCIAGLFNLTRVLNAEEMRQEFFDEIGDAWSLDRPERIHENQNEFRFEPHRGNAARLDAESTLNLTDHLPHLDGATALWPLYAAFVQAVYPKNDGFSEAYRPFPYDGIGMYQSDPRRIVFCSRTAGAYDNLINGLVDIIFCFGPSADEIKKAGDKGLRFNLTPIGKDAFVFFVNANNPVRTLSRQQIRDIYSGRLTNWKSITGRDEPVIAYQRDENSGSQTALQSIMGNDRIMEPMREAWPSEMGRMVDKVADYWNYQSAIGYSFLYYVTTLHKNSGIKALPVDGIPPNSQTVHNGSYPFVQEVYAITIAGRESANTRKFIEWILGPQGQRLVELTGYVPN